MRSFAAVYRAILQFAPEAFRHRYADEATGVALQRIRDRRGVRRLSAAARELADAIATVRRERRQVRRGRTWASMSGLPHDLQQAVRSLRSTPGFTAVALTILTLGIGASTAIFSVVDAVVLRGLPYDEGDRIYSIGRVTPGVARPAVETAQTYLDWRDRQDVFESLAVTAGAQFAVLSADGAPPESLGARRVSASLFPLLRVQPAVGRAFTSENEVEGHQRVALISDGLWRRRFGADPAIVGKTMRTETATWEIVGVMQPEFNYPVGASKLKPIDVWVPFAPTAADRSRESGRNFTWSVIGRVKPNVTSEQARAQIQHITDVLAREYPKWFKEYTPIGVVRLKDATVGGVRPWMMLLLGAVAVVLLIACVNVANLMLARATTRERELAVRAALGGTRWRIARGLLVESLLLSAIATALGVLVAFWGVDILKASIPQGVPRLASVDVDVRVLIAAALTATVTGVLFGLTPAIQGSRTDLTRSLRDGGRSTTAGAGQQRLRAGLVVAEVTLAVVLLVGAGLFISSFLRFTSVDLGFDTRNVFTLDAYLNFRDPSWRTRGRPFVAEILERLRTIPAVEGVAAVSNGLPLTGSWNRTPVTRTDGTPINDPDGVLRREISPDYFTVMRIPLMRGRGFGDADSMGAPPVMVVSHVMERIYFPGGSALGQSIKLDNVDRLIVGVVGGIRTSGPEADVWPELYVPVAQSEVNGADFVLRTHGPPGSVRDAAIAAIRAVRPEQQIMETQTLEGYFGVIVAQRKFNMQLLGVFGLLGIVIAAAGIYGVMAYIVAQRTSEIGIRMALGAVPSQVLGQVLQRAMIYVTAGLVLGLTGAWGLSRFVGRFLFQAQANSPAVYLAVALVLLAAGLLAAFIPARRAARVDPVIALRS